MDLSLVSVRKIVLQVNLEYLPKHFFIILILGTPLL